MLPLLGEINDYATNAIPDSGDLSERSLIVVHPPSVDMATFIPLIRASRGQSVPRTVCLLAAASSAMTLTRRSERELLVRAANGFLARAPIAYSAAADTR